VTLVSGEPEPTRLEPHRSLNPFAGLRDAIPAEEATDPAVARQLEQRFRHTILFATLGTIPTAIGFGAMMWFVAPSIGLIVWLVAALSTLGAWLWALQLPADAAWMRLATVLQVYGGLVWGSLPVLAMPDDPTWQLFLAAFGMGVQSSSVLFAAQIRRLFYAFHIPNATLSLVGFLLFTEGAGRLGGGLLAYAAVFAAGLSELHHLTALSASTFSIRAARLASGLAAKSEALGEANQRLAAQARTDPLTALANRYDFDHRLAGALDDLPPGAADRVVGVAMIDLDGFKGVNDTLGHRVGDLLLVAVGQRLTERLVPGEALARFGGDELVVVSPSLDPTDGPHDLGRRLSSAFDQPYSIEGRRLDIGACIGVADSSASTEARDLLRFADIALYLGKRQGKGRVEVFDAELHQRLRDRRRLEDELTTALGLGHLSPYLQPFVDLRTGAIIGAEALIRWIRPDGVRVAGTFFDVIDELGMVDEVTDRLLDDLTAYRLSGTPGSRLPISVNVAPDQLEGLLDRVEGSDVLAGLMLEITEQTPFGRGAEGANRLVDRAHACGAMVLLDDFGIGYSSLARAAKLDVDGYKLDRLFVAELPTCPDARAVMVGMVEIARRQGRELIAEGVETREQAMVMTELGVTTAQGFLYSPAVPLAEFDALVASGKPFVTTVDAAPAPPATDGPRPPVEGSGSRPVGR
jgi:diguanylate cyclase (GGDEF)-like protein